MSALKGLNLGVRFLLEVCLLVSLAISGHRLFDGTLTRLIAAISLPLIAALIWWLYVAPKAERQLQQPYRLMLELVLFGTAAALLHATGYTSVALMFASAVLMNEALILAWRQ